MDRRRNLLVVGTAAIAAAAFGGAFMGGTQLGAHVWPGAETKVRTEVVEKTWDAEDRCEKAWPDYAIASAGGAPSDRRGILYERLGKVYPPELRP